MKKDKKYSNVKVTALENSEVLIEGEIVAEHLEECRKNTLKKLSAGAEIPGFRKGSAPEHIIARHFGEMRILEDAAQGALDSQYWDIVSDNSIKAIGTPAITVTKLAAGNPLGFKIKTAVLPEFSLPDYKSLAKAENAREEEPQTVEQKEVDAILEQLQKSKTVDKKLPELNDKFAKSIGEFKTIAELTEKIRENMLAEKKMRAAEKKRLAILEALVEATTIAVPEVLIESELQKMLAQFKDDIARSGLKYEDYLTHIKKTEDGIKKEWRDNAIKRAKTQLILGRIAREEKITPDEEQVKKEIDHVVSHHKDADRFRVRMFVENMMTNEKVLAFLEGLK